MQNAPFINVAGAFACVDRPSDIPGGKQAFEKYRRGVPPYHDCSLPWRHAARLRSLRASFMIEKDDCRNRAAMTTATVKSGHGVCVHATNTAAITTATLPMASLRL